jgi:hypothetical protein
VRRVQSIPTRPPGVLPVCDTGYYGDGVSPCETCKKGKYQFPSTITYSGTCPCRIRTQQIPKPNKKYMCSRKLVWMTTCKIFTTTWTKRATYIGVWDLVIRTSSERVSHHNICTGKPRWDLLTNMWRGDGTDLLQNEGSLTGKVDVRGGARGRKEWGRCPDNWFVFQTFYYDQQKWRSVFFFDKLWKIMQTRIPWWKMNPTSMIGNTSDGIRQNYGGGLCRLYERVDVV